MKYKASEVVDWVREVLIAEGYFRRASEKEFEKPRHGNCCTCQTCGKDHDHCICDDIEYNRLFDIMKKDADKYFLF